jgi:AcrR family transcriptional regulator
VNGRQQKALATRRRILKAAYQLFCERGYAATTMELIAKRADVAVQTLYFTFHTKGAILEETVGACILGFERWDPRMVPTIATDPRKAFQEVHAWFPAFERAKSQREALAVFIDASVDILARVAPLTPVMTSAKATDPQVKVAATIGEQRRVEGYEFMVELLAKRGKLKKGMTHERATDILLAILSGETWLHLIARRWSRAECRAWFVDVLTQQFFE